MTEPAELQASDRSEAALVLARTISQAHGHDYVWEKDLKQALRAIEALREAGYVVVRSHG